MSGPLDTSPCRAHRHLLHSLGPFELRGGTQNSPAPKGLGWHLPRGGERASSTDHPSFGVDSWARADLPAAVLTCQGAPEPALPREDVCMTLSTGVSPGVLVLSPAPGGDTAESPLRRDITGKAPSAQSPAPEQAPGQGGPDGDRARGSGIGLPTSKRGKVGARPLPRCGVTSKRPWQMLASCHLVQLQ